MRVIGDIGGTNARFAIARDGLYDQLSSYHCADYPTLEDCLRFYLGERHLPAQPDEIALAVAGPVTSDAVALTNHPWHFRQTTLQSIFGAKRVIVVNDFTANALSLPYLPADDLEAIGGGAPKANAIKAILGPGTGLGVSGLVRGNDGHWVPIEGEGGHVTMPATNAREASIIALLRQRYDHVSAERVLSGDGLVNLYEAITQLDGHPSTGLKAAQIADPRLGESDPHAHEAVMMFCACLGTVAGDLALTLGALGGVFIAGGIVPRLGARFASSEFRRRFEAKGRFRDYLRAIPTYLITHQNPALIGLSRMR